MESSILDSNIEVELEFLITSEDLNLDTLKNLQENDEIEITNPQYIIAINKLPFYIPKIKEENGLIIGKILKILEPSDALKYKEKYLI
ncbi:hypothetical protein [Persephonella sp. KM09-Lau-8]|uniref:hypothetical protein n=1 Tax=Persephonella sp. KM09-Lau-8 TaxID=1158345 RepID=UPI0004972713|nr:hypothetical protein [Persephonella sp. KM09-Lau-8]